ncbi:MAG: amidase family protein, partial [Sphingomonadales bacterium]
MTDLSLLAATDIAAGVRGRRFTAREVARASLDRIGRLDPSLNCFTDVLADRALEEAEAVDRKIASGDEPGALAGVPFGVKNLFDVADLPTLAGSKINRDLPPARADGVLVARMKAAGAVLVGAQHMDEYAYGFTTENAHYGPARNPHDPAHVAGGSSGGSAAAVAAGMVPISLGSDTNGSIRVPASFCGIFGLKPTFGRLPRTGSFPFVHDLDHLGPFARSVADLALAYDMLQGWDSGDPACANRPIDQ